MKTCIPPEIASRLKDSLEKGEIGPEQIERMLPEEQRALRSLLEDFVSDKLGVNIKESEIKAIDEKAKKIDDAAKKLGDNLGNPEMVEDNIKFFKAQQEMKDYLLSLTPSSNLKVLTGTIGRGSMLASIKTPLLNIGSNIELAFTEALSRRINNFQIRGTDNRLAIDYVNMANKIYQKTGYDVSRMMDLKDTGTEGKRVLGETVHSEGTGAIRKVGRLFEDIVFKQLLGAPDVAFSASHFADSANLNSLKLANGDKVKAREIMVDSMRLEPTTPEGKIIRSQAILDAQKATWTDTTLASRVSEGIRKIINEVSGDLRLGDYLLPFIKTPANVIATGMDYAGMGIPKALVKTIKALRTGEPLTKANWENVSRDLVRSGLGLVGAFIIASNLKDDDFVGAYDPNRAQIESLRNSNYNAVKIGGKWISTAWLGPLAVPVTAMMFARKYGSTPGEKTFQYSKGVLMSALDIPGVSDIYDEVKSQAYKKNQTLDEMAGSTGNYLAEEIAARLTPSLMSDIAKATDTYERKTSGSTFFVPNTVIAKIPGARQSLPVKTNVFGEKIRGEGPISDILFGSRVKTGKETPVVKEIVRVSEAVDKGINFTDWDKSSSIKLAQFKKKIGESKYEEAKIKYGKELKNSLEKTISSPAYKILSDEDKLKVINNKDADAIDKIFSEYGFKYKQAPTTKIPKGL